ARIYDLLHDKHDLRPEDMLKVQTDAYSYPHAFLAEQFVAAAQVAPPKDPRAKKLIEQAKDWNGIADPNSVVVSFLHSALYCALDLLLEPHLGPDTELYHWRKLAFLQRVLTERPARWLPTQFKNYDELLSAAADRAVERLEKRTNKSNPEDWQWKRFNYLDMLHPLGREGFLKKLFSISDQPQAGTDSAPAPPAATMAPRSALWPILRIGIAPSFSSLRDNPASPAASTTPTSFITGSKANLFTRPSATPPKPKPKNTR